MTSNTNSLPEFDHTQIIASELPEEAQKKLEVIQSLLEPCGLAPRAPSAAHNLW